MGGDSFVKTTDEDAGERGGGYTNDVWVTEGSGWEIYSEGSKPMIKSTMEWDEVNPGRLPPAGVAYEDWIICQVPEMERLKGREGGDSSRRRVIQDSGGTTVILEITKMDENK